MVVHVQKTNWSENLERNLSERSLQQKVVFTSKMNKQDNCLLEEGFCHWPNYSSSEIITQ